MLSHMQTKKVLLPLDCVKIRVAALFYQKWYVAIGYRKEKEYSGVWKRRQYVALCGELASKDAVDLL